LIVRFIFILSYAPLVTIRILPLYVFASPHHSPLQMKLEPTNFYLLTVKSAFL
jgi:hypothetical protein